MSILTKSLTIGFTILSLGMAATAHANDRGGGGGGGVGEPAGVMAFEPVEFPVLHFVPQKKAKLTQVRIISMQPCADGNAIMNPSVCQPRIR